MRHAMRMLGPIASANGAAHDEIEDRPGPAERDSAGQESIELDLMTRNAMEAAQFLRCIANPHRLMVLCHLTHGEASVGQLERELGIRQAHLSQQLARLRQDGLVTTRRNSRTIYYALGSEAARRLVGLVYDLFCQPQAG